MVFARMVHRGCGRVGERGRPRRLNLLKPTDKWNHADTNDQKVS